MTGGILLLIALAAAAIAYVSYRAGQFMKYGGKMLVTCPETGKPAAVKVDLWRAIVAAVFGRYRVRLCACSRWPERAGCAQDCLCQIESNPEAHQAWTVAAKWFAGKKCAYCGDAIPPVTHMDRMPALVNLEKKTYEWNEIPPEDLPDAFEACKPVCWNCHIAETFIRQHPDLVTFRPWKKGGPVGEYVPKHDEQKKAPPRAA